MRAKLLHIGLPTLGILLIPFIVMQFTGEVNWNLFDFVVMGMLIFSTWYVYETISKKVDKKHKIYLALILLIAFLWLWAELAVGVITNWGS